MTVTYFVALPFIEDEGRRRQPWQRSGVPRRWLRSMPAP